MTDLFDRILLLKKSPIFSEVVTEDLRIIAQAREKEVYLKSDRVFDINEQGDHMYKVAEWASWYFRAFRPCCT